jgi:hypothetical protein
MHAEVISVKIPQFVKKGKNLPPSKFKITKPIRAGRRRVQRFEAVYLIGLGLQSFKLILYSIKFRIVYAG